MKILRFILLGLTVACIIGAIVAWKFYSRVYEKNIFVTSTQYLYITKDADFETVKQLLQRDFKVLDIESFEWTAKRKNYPSKIHGGRYKIKDGMTNNELVNMLRSGLQEPVNVSFNNLHTIEQLCAKISKQLEIDSTYLSNMLNNNSFTQKYGFTPQTISSMFIPDTYQFYWNISAENFVEKMNKIYKNFWTEENINKAKEIGFNPLEVSVLASIVQSEQSRYKDEQPTIAGLYINRLKIGMPLQSDPTIVYAIGDFTIKRVVSDMLNIQSPYNTYINTGLPPSVIAFPEKSALNAVLNYQHNDYIFMCAKSDFSGRHNFARTYEQHLKYAKEYRKALSEKGIR